MTMTTTSMRKNIMMASIIYKKFSVWKLCLFLSILSNSQISAGFRHLHSVPGEPFSSSNPVAQASSSSSSSGCTWSQNEQPETNNNGMNAAASLDNNNKRAKSTSSSGSILCHVRTLNSDFWNISSSISYEQKQSTTSIHIKCNDKLFFESFLTSNQSLFQLPKLNSVRIESCKIRKFGGNLSWRKIPNLKSLVIQTFNSEWSSSIELELEPTTFMNNGGFGGVLSSSSVLEFLDLSFNNIWTLPTHLFCPLTQLQQLNLSRNHIIEIPQEFGSLVQQRSFSSSESSYCTFSIATLDLSLNSIRKIDSNAFSRLRKLTKLSLGHNFIDELEDDAFSQLESLKLLNMTSNRLVALPPSIFKSASELSEIYLTNNSISALSPQVFSSLQQLLLLDLSKNLLSSQWIKESVFSGLIRLIVLKLSFNQLSFIDASLFSQLTSLQALYLNNNRIERVDPSAFSTLSNLHVLDLSRNLLTFIDAKQFSNSYILKQLYLDHNRIRTIDVDSFRNCTSLQDLGLAGNLLLEVPTALSSNSNNKNSGPLQNLNQLKTLDLGENKISFVTNESFAGLTKLYGLRMVDNRIAELPDSFCSSLKSLRVLNFGQNRLKRISTSAFNGCPELRALRLDKNLLEELPNSYSEQLPRLLWLNLTENQLRFINPNHLPPSLEWIDLSWNRLESLGDMYSNGLRQDGSSSFQLRVLDASHNNLTFLDYRSIPSSLETLRLNNNRLKSIASDTFIRAPRLRRIELTENEIETLPLASLRFSTIAVGAPIPEIAFSGNPFLCHCDLEWLTRLGQLVLQRQYPRLADFDQLECRLLPHSSSSNSTSTGGRGQGLTISLRNAKPSDFLCPYQTLCFPLCLCCDFEACDCNYQCPENCTCHHDTAWSTNIVQCSSNLAFGNTAIPSRIPMDATQLYLDGNHFPTLPSHTFIGKRNLRTLYLNGSHIQILKNKTFNGLKSLEKLHLQDNLLTQFDGYEFSDLENLSELYLHNNLLKYITPNTFSSLKLLSVLRLDGNLLYDFSIWELSKNSYLNSIMLSSNPWSCDCEFIIPFRSWVSSRSSTIVDFPLAKCQLSSNNNNNNNDNQHNNNKENGYEVDNDHLRHLNQLSSTSSSSKDEQQQRQLQLGSGSASFILISSRCSTPEESTYNNGVNHFNNPASSSSSSNGALASDSAILPYNNNHHNHIIGINNGGGAENDSNDNDSGDDDDNDGENGFDQENSLIIQEKFNNSSPPTEFDSTIFWAIFLSLTFILIFTLAVLGVVFRSQLHYWWTNSISSHMKCLPLSSCSSSSSSEPRDYDAYDDDDGSEEKLFDAYFLYSRKDEDLLLYKICPELECCSEGLLLSGGSNGTTGRTTSSKQRSSLRLCLHFRDLCLNLDSNPWNPSMIATACEVSKRVVILLSGSFIQTEWTNNEFREALSTLLSSPRHQKKLIFILLPPLSEQNLVGLSTSYYKNNNNISNVVSSSSTSCSEHGPPVSTLTSSSSRRNQRNLKGTTLEWTDENFWTKFKLLLPTPSTAYSSGSTTNDQHLHQAQRTNSRLSHQHLVNQSINSQLRNLQCFNISQQQQQGQILPNYTLNNLQQQNHPFHRNDCWSSSSPSSTHYFQQQYGQKGSQLSPENQQHPTASLLGSRYYVNNLNCANNNSALPVQWTTPQMHQFPQNNNSHSQVPQYIYEPQSYHSGAGPIIPPHHNNNSNVSRGHHHQHLNQQQLFLLQQQQQQQQQQQLHVVNPHQFISPNLPIMHQHQNSVSTISNTYRPLTEQNYSDSTNTLGSTDDDELNHIYSTLDSPVLQSPNLNSMGVQAMSQNEQQSQHLLENNSSSLTRIEFANSSNSLNNCLLQVQNNTNASSSGISSCEELAAITNSISSPESGKNLHLLNSHARTSSTSENNNNAGQMYFV